MAKLSARGHTILASVDLDGVKYSARSDGALLRQWRFNGRLETATIVGRYPDGATAVARLERIQNHHEAPR